MKSHRIQSVIIDKNKYSLIDAIIWILKNNFKVKKVDETENYWRFRQLEPNKLKDYNYKTIEKADGIKEIIAFMA